MIKDVSFYNKAAQISSHRDIITRAYNKQCLLNEFLVTRRKDLQRLIKKNDISAGKWKVYFKKAMVPILYGSSPLASE